MSHILELIFTQFNKETIIITSCLFFTATFLLIFYWVMNKKKFNKFGHYIPASILKGHLDTIIQNSSAIRSSLSRGGVAEMTPSVIPSASLTPTSGDTGISPEMLNQKNAEIASLNSLVTEKNNIIKELEAKLANAGTGEGDPEAEAKLAELNQKVQGLEKELEEAKQGSGGSSEELDKVTQENKDLKERLQEYEIIEDDLANLKKLQTENEELKKQLAGAGGAAPAQAAPEPPPAAPEPKPEAPPAEATNEDAGTPDLGEDDKTAEDLLSEFEKMLG